MSPRKKKDDEEPRADETQEYELEDEELDDKDLEDQDVGDDDLDEDEDLDEEYEDDEELDDKDELEHVVSAETQEWEGLEAAEAESAADEPTFVASATQRVKQAGSAITSGFEKVGGQKVTSGFKAVRRHVGFPVWLRFLTASFVIVAAVAGATSTSLILYLSDIADALKKNEIRQDLGGELAGVPNSGAQTIMILGSDKRNNEISGKYGLSDTTMLLRLDPDRNAISLLSLPRDLKVDIPGYGVNKLNAAYSFGGPKLTLQTVKQILGPQIQINHLVNVDFTGFARAVNAIGCVYVDVDRRYYIAPNSGTSEINLQPGYQALCGFDALSFARYRHTDNDIVRAARQQAFLREARAKVPPSRLIDDRHKLLHIFTSYTSSDIGSETQLLELLKLFFDLRGAQIKQVHFQAELGPSYVTATQSQIHTAVAQFLGVKGTPGPVANSAKPTNPVSTQTAPDATKPRPVVPKKKKKKNSTGPSNLVETSYGKQIARSIRRRKLKVPVYYPTVLESGSEYAQRPRAYKINGKGDESPPHSERAAYKWVFSLPTIGDYYGFEGTRWKNPPILDNPSETKTIGDRDYLLFYDGDELRMVGWKTDQGSFWVSNSYIESVPNEDMLKIAEGFHRLPGT